MWLQRTRKISESSGASGNSAVHYFKRCEKMVTKTEVLYNALLPMKVVDIRKLAPSVIVLILLSRLQSP